MTMYRIPGVAGRIIARQRQALAPEKVDRSLDEMRTLLTAAGVRVHKNWGAKKLAAEVAKLERS